MNWTIWKTIIQKFGVNGVLLMMLCMLYYNESRKWEKVLEASEKRWTETLQASMSQRASDMETIKDCCMSSRLAGK